MTPQEKGRIVEKLKTISAQIELAGDMYRTLPEYLPPAPPHVPIMTFSLTRPIANAVDRQTDALKELIELIEEIVEKD